tara:strand:- start:684 stop:854 length:171 start_codon:yes stop_codon:yes gene_type:complete
MVVDPSLLQGCGKLSDDLSDSVSDSLKADSINTGVIEECFIRYQMLINQVRVIQDG